jgi:hypothetical protein
MPFLYASRPVEDAAWPGFPHIDGAFLFKLVRSFSVTALEAPIASKAAVLMLVAVVIGAIAAFTRDRRSGAILVGMAFLPLAFSLLALRALDHFYAVRYVTPAVIGFAILAGIGVAAAAERISRNNAIVALALMLIFSGVFATQTWPIARREAFQKLDWRNIALALRKHLQHGDVILAAEPWSEVSLRYYLGEVPGVRLIHMLGPGIAQIVAEQAPAAWLVTAGVSPDPSVREWMCRYPVLLASPLENFRLHYAPAAQHFLRRRSVAPEQRAMSAALGDRGFTLHMGTDDDVAVRYGWALPEGTPGDTFRWAEGRRANLMFPRRGKRNRTIRFHAMPMSDPKLPPQNVRVSLNAVTLGSVRLTPQWSDYSMDAPADYWLDGMNTVTLDFDRSTMPLSLDPSSHDERSLAAAFRTISIDDVGFDSTTVHRERLPVPAMRAAADVFLNAHQPRPKTRFAAELLNRGSVESLLGRMGFDPVTIWPRIARGELRIEDVVATLAAGSDCQDDAAFLRRAFVILLERKPNDIEQRDLLQRLREGTTRERVLERITKADDFRLQ